MKPDQNTQRGRARQRYEQRKQYPPMASKKEDLPSPPLKPSFPFELPSLGNRAEWLQDVWWHLRHHPTTRHALIVGGGLMVLFVLVSVLFSPSIGYNVWSMGIPLTGKTVDEAQGVLSEAWTTTLKIDLMLNGERLMQVTPSELGIKMNPYEIAQQARAVGVQGFPMGYDVIPTLTTDEGALQTLLLDLVDDVYIPPYEAGYEWQNGQLVGVKGRASRELDVMMTLESLRQNPLYMIKNRRLDLITKSTPPLVVDPMPYLEQAKRFLSQSFTLIGYDPFKDVRLPWTSTQEEITRWLLAGTTGLALRPEAFKPFVNAVNAQLAQDVQPRYLDEREVMAEVNRAIAANENTAYLRVRYLPTVMTLSAGDWGQRIARKTGIPFRLIENANPNTNWNQLSIGQQINLPSRDLLLVEPPVPNKRIIVDLDRRYMVAYENGEIAFHWRISIGREEAPTYPGIFQVLTHAEKAFGSGFSLCTSTGCAQWEMMWFMGIYEVVPGLMNGFHGAVLLPNGAYLDDGRIGGASTFGCVMAGNTEAEQLFRWADKGTVVEVVSGEFQPESELGRQAMAFISSVLG